MPLPRAAALCGTFFNRWPRAGTLRKSNLLLRTSCLQVHTAHMRRSLAQPSPARRWRAPASRFLVIACFLTYRSHHGFSSKLPCIITQLCSLCASQNLHASPRQAPHPARRRLKIPSLRSGIDVTGAITILHHREMQTLHMQLSDELQRKRIDCPCLPYTHEVRILFHIPSPACLTSTFSSWAQFRACLQSSIITLHKSWPHSKHPPGHPPLQDA